MPKERILNLITEVKKFVYDKDETDVLLSTKAEVIHSHEIEDVNELDDELTDIKTDIDSITNNVYDKTVIDTKLDNKADKTDTYTKDVVDSKLSEKAPLSHNHNDLYNTKAEISTLLADKANLSHNHNNSYYLKSEVDDFIQEIWNYIIPEPEYLFFDDCTGNNPSEKYQIQSGMTASYTTFEDEPVLSLEGTVARSIRPILDRTQNDVKITWSQYMRSTATIGNHYFALIFNNTKNANVPSVYPWYLGGFINGTCGIRKDNTGSYPFISGTFTAPKQTWLNFELTIIGNTFTLTRLDTSETVTATDSSLTGLNLEFYKGSESLYMKNIKIEEV